MEKKDKSVHTKRGRRPTGRNYGETIPVRLAPEDVADVDAWIERQDGKVSRSEAVRRLLRQALGAEKKG
jgi:hypothetical protein